MQAQLNRCNLPFSLLVLFSPFQAGGLCLEWKFTSPAEAQSHQNTGLLKWLYAPALTSPLKTGAAEVTLLRRVCV